MIQFTCRKCSKSAIIDRFRSRYVNVCFTCYQSDTARKNLQLDRRYSRLKYTAKQRGVSVELSRQEFDAYQTLDCRYCGLPVSGRSAKDRSENTGSGLDRMDSSKGYTNDNVVPACFLCNRTKNDWFSYDEMLVLGKTIRSILDARPQS